jgi:hypothetical protein
MADFRNTWVVLAFRRQRRQNICVYTDGFHNHRQFEFDSSERFASVPRDISQLVADLVKSLPSGRPGMRGDIPVPLPIFVRDTELPAGVLGHDVFGSIRFTGVVDTERLQFVHSTKSSARNRIPFRLPFRVLTLGDSARYGLRSLLGRPWLQSLGRFRADAIDVTEVTAMSLRRALARGRCDVLFVSDPESKFAHGVISKLPLWSRPRLLVDRSIRLDSVPQDGSVLHAPRPGGGHRLGTEILFGLIHDLPLHETLRAVVHKLKPVAPFALYSNPVDNNSMRISDDLITLRQDALEIQAYISWMRPEFLGPSAVAPAALAGAFEGAGTTVTELRDSTATVIRSIADFSRESTGLVPLVMARREFESSRSNFLKLRGLFQRIHRDSESIEYLRQRQKRVVDVALDRLEADHYLTAVESNCSLKAGGRYQVTVHVGTKMPGSLVQQTPPRIDALLPSTRKSQGHLLDIVVQQKDFNLLSEPQQTVFLPTFGASRQVRFAVRAPLKPGPASLRVLIYFRNQLLQTFLLRTRVTKSEQRKGLHTTRVRLEFSRSARLANLERFTPRALSIAVNNNFNGTHDINVKGKEAVTCQLGEAGYRDAMDKIRQVLEAATIVKGTEEDQVVYESVESGSPASPQAAETLRQLANEGHEIFNSFFRKIPNPSEKGDPDLPADVRALRDGRGATIQIARLNEGAVLPWAMLYDFELPEDQRGDVCLGLVNKADGTVTLCDHGARSRAYCINGFWGVRHIVEEVIKKSGADDAVLSIPKPKDAEPMCVAMDVSVAGVPEFHTELKNNLGNDSVAGPLDAKQLVQLLWQEPPKRPTVLVVLGHLNTSPIAAAGEPPIDRIQVAEHSWLTHARISDEFNHAAKHWEQPRPLVLLMACTAAATTESKLNDFVLALNAAGAGAIVGPECSVFPDLACSFAKFLTLRMWTPDDMGKHVSLGKAMNEYRVQTLQSGNPLAFVFRSVGEADLVLET